MQEPYQLPVVQQLQHMVLSIVLSVGLLMAQEHRLPLPILVQGISRPTLPDLLHPLPITIKPMPLMPVVLLMVLSKHLQRQV